MMGLALRRIGDVVRRLWLLVAAFWLSYGRDEVHVAW